MLFSETDYRFNNSEPGYIFFQETKDYFESKGYFLVKEISGYHFSDPKYIHIFWHHK
jgi:uncharacterized protein (UPF0297 family)